jgi:hypothetical protein
MGIYDYLTEAVTSGGQAAVNALVETCIKLARSYLRFSYHKIAKHLQNDSLTFNEFAISSAAPLFKRDENDRFVSLEKAMASWKHKITDDAEAMYFLSKLVSKQVAPHIFDYYRENDPLFAKVYDSLHYHIRTSGVKKISHLAVVYLIRQEHSVENLEWVDREHIEAAPAPLFVPDKGFLTALFGHFDELTSKPCALPLSAIIERMKGIIVSSSQISNRYEDEAFNIDASAMIEQALTMCKHKLHKSYYAKGKLTGEEASALFNTLKIMTKDMKDGGIKPGLFEYLKQCLPAVSRAEYDGRHRHILEYLIKLLKKNLAAGLSVHQPGRQAYERAN